MLPGLLKGQELDHEYLTLGQNEMELLSHPKPIYLSLTLFLTK